VDPIATYAILDPFLQYSDETQHMSETTKTLPTYVETLAKTSRKHLKVIASICNIQMKHLQDTYETPETYVYNMHVYATSKSIFAISR
jgi:hypothetical protein